MDLHEIEKAIDIAEWGNFFPNEKETFLKGLFNPQRYLEGILFLYLFRF